MKSRIRLFFLAACFCSIMYLCWNMGAMTAETRLQILYQHFMTDSHKSVLYTQLNNSVDDQPMQVLVTKRINTTTTPHVHRLQLHSKNIDQPTMFPPTLVHGRDINPDIAKFFTLRANEIKDQFINLHQYKFMLNSQICSEGGLFLVVVVHSAPGNTAKRNLIRKTFGSVHMYRGKKLGVVFMLGAVKGESLQDPINRESEQYRDIVQGNFVDSYKSLNRKHIMAMYWQIHHCKAQYILKLDDDTFVNPFRMVDFIVNENLHGMTMHCKILKDEEPIRDNKSKWHTPKSQYPFPILPPFCLGFAYLTTPEAWRAMYKASERNRLMTMDDLYVSIVLAMKAKVRKVDMTEMMYQSPGQSKLPLSLESLNSKTVFLDRHSRFGAKPFFMWDKLRNLNKDL